MDEKQTVPNAPGGRKGPLGSIGRLLALIAAAACLRVWAVAALAHDLRIREPVLDGLYYLQLAGRLAAGQGWPAGPIFMTPFYPAVLSALFRAGLSGVLAVQVLQSVLGIAALILLFLTVRRDLGPAAGWAAALLSLLCGPILAMESQVLTESLLLLLTTAALWLWPRGTSRPARSLLFGLICGLLVIGRGIFLLLPAGALILLWWKPGLPARTPRSRGEARGAGALRRTSAAILLGFLVSLVPLAVRQTATTGHLRFLTVNGGLNLYLGNNPWARGLYSVPPGIDLQQDFTATRSASVAMGHDLSLVEADQYYRKSALGFLREHPARALWLFSRKALLFWSPHEIPQIEVYDLLRRSTLPLRLAWIDFRWILPLTVLGVVTWWRRRGEETAELRLAPYLLLVATGWVATILFFATGRYRVPFLPAFLGLAGLGAAQLPRLWSDRRGRLLLLVLPLVALLQLALPSYPRAKSDAFDSYQLGVRLARAGRNEEALRAYQRAAELWPEDGQAWHGVGAALVRLGRLPDAVAAYRNALETLPSSALTHYNLGAVYGRLGDDAQALAEFRAAVALDPYELSYRSDLGIALARTGHREEALQEFRRVLQRDPHHASARRGLEMLGVTP